MNDGQLKDMLDRMDRAKRIADLLAIVKPGDWRARLNAYREAYRLASPWIAAGEYLPYAVDTLMTPIELAVWQQIQLHSLPFYPQYPVGRFTADFGDPTRRIAIECDGQAFHDADRDAVRDEILAGLGWRTVRIPGRACLLPPSDPQSAAHLIEHMAQTLYGKQPSAFRDVTEDEDGDEPR